MAQPIWTGSGWDYSLPDLINQSQIGQFWRSGSGDGQSYATQQEAAAAGGDRSTGTASSYYGFNDPALAKWAPNSHNYMAKFNDDGTLKGLQFKSGDKEGTFVPFTKDAAGNYTPDYSKIDKKSWDTNQAGEAAWSIAAVIAGGLGAGYGAEALGVAGAGAEAGGIGTLSAAGVPQAGVTGSELGLLGGGGTGTLSASSVPAFGGVTGTELGLYGGGGAAGMGGLGAGGMGPSAEYAGVAAGTTPYGPPAAYAGSGSSAVPGAGSSWMDYIKQAGQVGSAMNGGGGQQQSGTGGLFGGLLGAGLGYLDAASQPDSLTVRNEIDPRLAQAAYGPGGSMQAIQQAFAQSQGQPNYLGQAGQQISALGQQTPTSWADLVSQNKGMWDSNPWVTQQQNAITSLATRNLNENVMPGIGSSANAAGGYGGSRQGIAQGLAASRLNQDLAPALTGLASNAYESAQNRAMQGAQYQGQYGMAGTAQQAGLLAQGANMQAGAPWANVNQYANLVRGLPGNTSTTYPLFNNPIAGALGGAQAGSNWAGNVDWGQLAGTIGGWFK